MQIDCISEIASIKKQEESFNVNIFHIFSKQNPLLQKNNSISMFEAKFFDFQSRILIEKCSMP